MKKIGEHFIKTSSTSNVEPIVSVSTELHVSAEIKVENAQLPMAEIVAPLFEETLRFNNDLLPVEETKEHEYSLVVARMSPNLRDGSNNPIPSHESNHAVILHKNHTTGEESYVTFMTSSANHSLEKTPNPIVDSVKMDGKQGSQRISHLSERRSLDPETKEGIDYTIDKSGTAYIHQDHIYDKIDIHVKEHSQTSPIIRRSEDSSVLYNELGHKQENEHVNTDFTDRHNHEEMD